MSLYYLQFITLYNLATKLILLHDFVEIRFTGLKTPPFFFVGTAKR